MPSERIPLPGAYPRALLPVLEERVASRRDLAPRRQRDHARASPRRCSRDADTPEELAALEPAGSCARRRRHRDARRDDARARGARPRASPPSPAAPTEVADGVAVAAVDYRESDVLREALADAVAQRGPIELAVCWIHTDAPEAPRSSRTALAPGGRLVQVFGTRLWPLAPVPLTSRTARCCSARWAAAGSPTTRSPRGVLDAIDADEPLPGRGRAGVD